MLVLTNVNKLNVTETSQLMMFLAHSNKISSSHYSVNVHIAHLCSLDLEFKAKFNNQDCSLSGSIYNGKDLSQATSNETLEINPEHDANKRLIVKYRRLY